MIKRKKTKAKEAKAFTLTVTPRKGEAYSKSFSSLGKAKVKLKLSDTAIIEHKDKVVAMFGSKDPNTKKAIKGSSWFDLDKPRRLKKESKTESSDDVIQYNFKTPGYGWLSSFQPCCIEVKDEKGNRVLFPSAEHAFHYFKTKSKLYREKILNAADASKARYWGSEKAECPMRDDWDDIREEVMYKILTAKYKQNLPLKKRLLATGDTILQELSPWDKELFWGTNKDGEGKNKHGKLTMRVRKKLASKE